MASLVNPVKPLQFWGRSFVYMEGNENGETKKTLDLIQLHRFNLYLCFPQT